MAHGGKIAILGIPDRRGDEKFLTSDEVRRRLGLPR